jgi:hypothetical protein
LPNRESEIFLSQGLDSRSRDCRTDLPVEAGQVCPSGQTVIARSDSDEAIHFSAGGAVDCFASLAMTILDTRV